jgi:hypothetical protein
LHGETLWGRKSKPKATPNLNKEDTETEQRARRKTALISVELAGVMTIEKMTKHQITFYTKCFLIGMLCVGMTAQQAPSSDTAQANQQKARAVLNQMIQALGGQAYMNLQTSESDGRYGRFYHGRSEASTEYHRYWEWPEKERIELTKQRDVVELTVGNQMYELTFRGSRTLDPAKDYDTQVYLARQHHALDVILRQWLNQPGIALFDEGAALTENHSVERISIITANNDSVSISVDTDTHLPVKKSFVIRDPQGYRDEIGEIYDNWKMVQGVNTPYNVLITRNGELSRQYFLSSITYNAPLQNSLFEPTAPFNIKKK